MQKNQKTTIRLTHFIDNYGNKKGIISFNGNLDIASFEEFKIHIDTAFNYFSYEELEILISSPGGIGLFMETLIETFERFKNEGRIIEVTANFYAMSAAAILLTSGTIGRRNAYKNSTLLYHYPRFIFNKNTVLKEEDAKDYYEKLEMESKKILNKLTEYALKTLEKTNDFYILKKRIDKFLIKSKEMDLIKKNYVRFDKKRTYSKEEILNEFEPVLKNAYDSLLKKEIKISPEDALFLLMIDNIKERR